MDSDSGAAAEALDLRGLKCPMPALLAKRALLRTAPGGVLDVVADDPLAALDIPHMCEQESFVVLFVRRDAACVWFRLTRPTAASIDPPSDPDAQ